MYGTGPARDLPVEARSRFGDFGARTLYGRDLMRPYTAVPQNLVAGPRPDASALSLHNIYNMPPVQGATFLPAAQQGLLARITSHFTLLPVGKRFQAPMGNS